MLYIQYFFSNIVICMTNTVFQINCVKLYSESIKQNLYVNVTYQ